MVHGKTFRSSVNGKYLKPDEIDVKNNELDGTQPTILLSKKGEKKGNTQNQQSLM